MIFISEHILKVEIKCDFVKTIFWCCIWHSVTFVTRECNVRDNTICLLMAPVRNNGLRFNNIKNTNFQHILINVAHGESARISKFTEFFACVVILYLVADFPVMSVTLLLHGILIS